MLFANSAKCMEERVKRQLAKHLARVMDLFRAMDRNNDGLVSRKEFLSGLLSLGVCPSSLRTAINSVFDEWDDDHSGTLEFGELHKKLRGAAVPPPKPNETNPMQRIMRKPPNHPAIVVGGRDVQGGGESQAAAGAGAASSASGLVAAAAASHAAACASGASCDASSSDGGGGAAATSRAHRPAPSCHVHPPPAHHRALPAHRAPPQRAMVPQRPPPQPPIDLSHYVLNARGTVCSRPPTTKQSSLTASQTEGSPARPPTVSVSHRPAPALGAARAAAVATHSDAPEASDDGEVVSRAAATTPAAGSAEVVDTRAHFAADDRTSEEASKPDGTSSFDSSRHQRVSCTDPRLHRPRSAPEWAMRLLGAGANGGLAAQQQLQTASHRKPPHWRERRRWIPRNNPPRREYWRPPTDPPAAGERTDVGQAWVAARAKPGGPASAPVVAPGRAAPVYGGARL